MNEGHKEATRTEDHMSMLQTLLTDKNWTVVNDNDESLFNDFFNKTNDNYSYENNWAFIKQATRYNAIKYFDGENLLTIISFNLKSPFLFVLPPPGIVDKFVDKIPKIAHQVKTKTQKRLVLRKIPEELCQKILENKSFEIILSHAFTFTNEIPEDIFPQVIIDIAEAINRKGSKWVKTRNQLVFFNDKFNPVTRNLSKDNLEDAIWVIHKWAVQYEKRMKMRGEKIVEPTKALVDAHNVFAVDFAEKIDNRRYFSKIIYVNGEPVGFTFAGRISKRVAALYSCLTVTDYRGASEFLLSQLFTELYNSDVNNLNMGGSENELLHKFRVKFQPIILRPTFDIEFKG